MLDNVRFETLCTVAVWISNIHVQLRRTRAASNESRELPPVDMGHSVEDFFDTVLKDSNAGDKLPNW